ncbi:DUF2306 domain-containing protein [Chryseosolibacter indicus]|uniref:DUF2306 domain-containing protein n=1 Tax=Chryseosolibacter indicus TaxID=2782351 RepID=A0ABS5VWD7_9BACT|nr:DUF2306 domain-containing protein [Chryseosolibacter indicus]MBT1705142.1 DUF2306 domain-containing protein [Chryseosolibacter indicus]
MKSEKSKVATVAMNLVVKSWFAVVFVGQIIFAYYILMLYWKSAAQGDFEKWNTATPHFYIKGDWIGNTVFGLHVGLAFIVTVLGPLQLIPSIRKRVPRVHRISGRIYILTAFIISVAGLYLSWVKGSVGDRLGAAIISVNALIIIGCAYYAVKSALKRKIDLHQRWAVHLFLAMSGVWYFRVFLMLWLAIFKAPVGFDPETFTGPFLTTLGIMVYIFPQVMGLYYFQVKRSDSVVQKGGFTTILACITIGMVIGIMSATMGMWLPRL